MFNNQIIFKLTLFIITLTNISTGYTADDNKQGDATPKRTLNADAPIFKPHRLQASACEFIPAAAETKQPIQLQANAEEFKSANTEIDSLIRHLNEFNRRENPFRVQTHREQLLRHLYRALKTVEEHKYTPSYSQKKQLKKACNYMATKLQDFQSNTGNHPVEQGYENRLQKLQRDIETINKLIN